MIKKKNIESLAGTRPTRRPETRPPCPRLRPRGAFLPSLKG